MNIARNYDVVIVGGGLAGLSAALELQKQGHRTIVLEARSELGGRICTTSIPSAKGSSRFDLGGQWVSKSQRDIMDLLLDLNIDTYEQYYEGNALIQNSKGNILQYHIKSTPWCMGIFNLISLGLASLGIDSLVKRYGQDSSRLQDEASLLQFLKQYHTNFFGNDLPHFFNTYTQASFGFDINAVGLKSFIRDSFSSMHEENEDDFGYGEAQRLKIVGCAGSIIDRIISMLPHDSIRLNSIVNLIEQDDEGVLVHVKNECFRASFCIIATPPQQLAHIQMNPSLPPHRFKLLSNMPMGNMIKVIVTYETCFWRDKGLNGFALTYTGPTCLVVDATNHDQEPALVAFIGGSNALQLSALSSDERRDVILNQLETLFGSLAKKYIAYVEKDWTREHFIGGCPGALPSIGSTTGCQFDLLRQPFGRIYFAGTEFALKWQGYMSGAVETAKQASKQVSHLLSSKNTCISVSSSESELKNIPNYKDAIYRKSDNSFLYATSCVVLGVVVAAAFAYIKRSGCN